MTRERLFSLGRVSLRLLMQLLRLGGEARPSTLRPLVATGRLFDEARSLLREKGLIEEEVERHGRKIKYRLKLTQSGRRLAELLCEAERLLESIEERT